MLPAFKEEPQSHTRSLRRCSDECDPSPFILPPVRVSYPLDSVITEARAPLKGSHIHVIMGQGQPRRPEADICPQEPGLHWVRGKELREQGCWKKEFSFIPLTLEKKFLYSNELKKNFFPRNCRFSSPLNRNLEAKLSFDISQHRTASSWNPLTGLVQGDYIGLVFPVSLFNSCSPAVWVVSPHFIHGECKAQRGSGPCLKPLS